MPLATHTHQRDPSKVSSPAARANPVVSGGAGHCEYFASAMVMLARAEGLPSRLVNGFAGGQRNDVGGFVEVTQADAHAWVEIHFERSGWVRFDPTPPDCRLRSETALSLAERAAQLASAVELWWFQRVVDYDSADQIGALRALWRRFAPEREGQPADPLASQPEAGRDPRAFGLGDLGGLDPRLLIALAALAGLLLLVRARRARRGTPDPIPVVYRRAQRILARRGIERAPNVSAWDFARRVAERLPEPGARAFAEITEAYLAERFGDAPAGDRSAALAALQDAVDRMGLRDHAHVR